MRVLFVNPTEEKCGVYQYGVNLFETLRESKAHRYSIVRPHSRAQLADHAAYFMPDAIIYNWAPGIGGWLAHAPFGMANKELAVYHDGGISERFDAVLFSDPTATRFSNWYPIGRPIPTYTDRQPRGSHPEGEGPHIGVNGFLGAWSPLAVSRIVRDFERCVIRLHLPSATYGDPSGKMADAQARQCQYIVSAQPGIRLEISHEFLPMADLLRWLSLNDLNVYMRDLPPAWRGVSSVLDCALAVRRPIAVNRCVAFRHVHNLTPSICVEDNSLKTILANGTAPLEPLYAAWAPEKIRAQVEACLADVMGIAQ